MVCENFHPSVLFVREQKGEQNELSKKLLFPDMEKRVWDGLKILKKQRIIRCITRHPLAFLIYSNKLYLWQWVFSHNFSVSCIESVVFICMQTVPSGPEMPFLLLARAADEILTRL